MADVTSFIAIGFFMFGVVSTETYPCGTGTIYPERGTQVVVDCGVPTDHIAVFWYRGSTGSDPFLRLENGRKTVSDGFHIQDNGAMVITSADVTHDGRYMNRVIGNDGQSRDTNITVEVKVSLESKPIIVDCSSSVHEICADVEEEKRQATLVCIAGPAKPPVTISWSSYDGTQQPSVDRNNQNASTSLYTSISLLQYDPSKYLFEYFTCDATGEAAAQNTTAVIFKKGNKDIDADDQNTKYVISGDDLSLGCSEFATHPMGEWGIVYPNKSFHLLWRKYPGNQAGSCRDGNNCEVHTDGSLRITDVTYIKEGHYVCAYSDSVFEGIREIPVEVLVSPAPGVTVIKGCEENEENNECEQNVANIGLLECSILGSRPSVKPNIIVDETVIDIDVFLFDDKRESSEGTVPGTFDTIHKVNYEIPECSGVVRVDCVPDNSKHEEKILKSYAKLITATSNCNESRGKPGLVAFLVIFFLALIIAAVVFIIKRDHVRRFITRTRHKKTQQDEEVGSGTGYSSSKREGKAEDPGTKLSELIQKSFDEVFQPIFDSVIAKKTENVDLKEMVVTFCEDQKVSDPLPYIFQFLRSKSSSLKEKDAMAIVKYILNKLPPEWISSFLKGLAEDLKGSYVSSTNYISLIGEAYRTGMIDIGQYVDLTGTLLQKHVITFDIIMSDLKSFVDKKHCSKEEFADSILQYYRRNYISDERLSEEVCGESLSFGFAFPYVLQSLYQHCQKKTDTESSQLLELFKKIWTKKMGDGKPFGPLALNGKNPNERFKAFRNSLINAYLFSYNTGLVDDITTVSMIDKTKINPKEFEILMAIFIRSEIVNSVDIVTNLLVDCISKKLISEDIYLNSLTLMLMEKQLSFDDFKNIIRESMEKKVVSERCFEEGVKDLIKKGAGNKRDWIIIVTELIFKNMIGGGVQQNIFQVVIKQHKMKKEEVKAILSDTGVTKENQKRFLEKLKF